MEKEFDRWNLRKQEIDATSKEIRFHEREIWWCSIGVNIGSEQHSQTGDFSRPVIIFKKWTPQIFWGIPLTTKIKKIKFRFNFQFNTQIPRGSAPWVPQTKV
jgi:mRNA interferase MazF